MLLVCILLGLFRLQRQVNTPQLSSTYQSASHRSFQLLKHPLGAGGPFLLTPLPSAKATQDILRLKTCKNANSSFLLPTFRGTQREEGGSTFFPFFTCENPVAVAQPQEGFLCSPFSISSPLIPSRGLPPTRPRHPPAAAFTALGSLGPTRDPHPKEAEGRHQQRQRLIQPRRMLVV